VHATESRPHDAAPGIDDDRLPPFPEAKHGLRTHLDEILKTVDSLVTAGSFRDALQELRFARHVGENIGEPEYLRQIDARTVLALVMEGDKESLDRWRTVLTMHAGPELRPNSLSFRINHLTTRHAMGLCRTGL